VSSWRVCGGGGGGGGGGGSEDGHFGEGETSCVGGFQQLLPDIVEVVAVRWRLKNSTQKKINNKTTIIIIKINVSTLEYFAADCLITLEHFLDNAFPRWCSNPQPLTLSSTLPQHYFCLKVSCQWYKPSW
jgi:hypothetical protein